MMKTLLVILISLTACCVALITILSVSYFKYETPSVQDAIGFGGLLLFIALFLVPICYLPTLHFAQKIRPGITRPGILLTLLTVGNLPAYGFLWMAQSKLGYGENYLFLIGFLVMAVVFGMAIPMEKKVRGSEIQ